MRKTLLALLFSSWTVSAQPSAFEAASVKPSKEGPGSSSWHSRPGYLVMKNQTLQQLTGIAYQVRADQVSGGPKWAESDRFDIEARAAGPANDPELLRMLQSLLSERFQLAVHRDTKSESGFALSPIKTGLKIPPDTTEGGSVSNGTNGKLVVQRVSMQKLADILTRQLRVPVIDATGATGVYSFTIEWSADDPAGTSLDAVLAQQLGLKLDNRKLPIGVVVIDRAEKPAAN